MWNCHLSYDSSWFNWYQMETVNSSLSAFYQRSCTSEKEQCWILWKLDCLWGFFMLKDFPLFLLYWTLKFFLWFRIQSFIRCIFCSLCFSNLCPSPSFLYIVLCGEIFKKIQLINYFFKDNVFSVVFKNSLTHPMPSSFFVIIF